MNTLFLIKHGIDLTKEEIDSINFAKNKEWDLPPMSQDHIAKHHFAMLKDESGGLIAQAQLNSMKGVVFDGEQFFMHGLGGFISHEKGKGYGRQLIKGIIQYLQEEDISAFGFTDDTLVGFYTKSGFNEDRFSSKRFVYKKDGQEIRNETQDCIFYFDGSDKFMSKVLSKSNVDVFLPREPNW